jgi:MFS family permease
LFTFHRVLLPSRWRELLSYRDYRSYFASSTIGAFASAVQFLAQGWLLFTLAPGGVALTAFLVVRFGVKSLLAVPAGLVADRYPRATLYAWMRAGSGAGSAISALAIITPDPIVVALIGAGIAGAAHAIDLPAHRALQIDVQPPQHLERGLAFGTSGFHVASLIAPVVAFPVAAAFGPESALLLSATAFAVAAWFAFRIEPKPVTQHHEASQRSLAAPLRLIRETPVVLMLLVATVLPSIIDRALAISLPATSGGGHGSTFGIVLAAPEAGGIVIAMLMSTLNWRFAPWMPIVAAGAYGAGVAAATFAGLLVGVEALALSLFLAGCARATLTTSAMAGIQRHVPAHLRGRIMTI